jgi:hypothetical protein
MSGTISLSTTIHNERVKLLATILNNAASWPRSSRRLRVVTSISAGMSSRSWLGPGSAWAYISARGLCLGDCDDVGSGRDIAHPAGRRRARARPGRNLAVTPHPMIPAHIGPCEFGCLGKLIAVRCPHEFDQVMRNAGGGRSWMR